MAKDCYDEINNNMNNIGVISILLSKREQHAQDLNKLLTENSHIIRVRTGYNLEPRCTADCLGVITLICEASQEEIMGLKQKIDNMQEAKVEAVILI